MQTATTTARRQRRPVPGSMSFDRGNPHVYLGTLSGARKHRSRPGSLLAPLDLDPETVSWPVADLDVLLVTEPDYAAEAARLAGTLLRDGASTVVIVDGSRTPARVHRAISSTHIIAAAQPARISSVPNFD